MPPFSISSDTPLIDFNLSNDNTNDLCDAFLGPTSLVNGFFFFIKYFHGGECAFCGGSRDRSFNVPRNRYICKTTAIPFDCIVKNKCIFCLFIKKKKRNDVEIVGRRRYTDLITITMIIHTGRDDDDYIFGNNIIIIIMIIIL